MRAPVYLVVDNAVVSETVHAFLVESTDGL